MHRRDHFKILSTFIKRPVVMRTVVLSILSGGFKQVLLYVVIMEQTNNEITSKLCEALPLYRLHEREKI